MHISDGVLSGPVLAAGWAATVALTAITTRKMDVEEIPKVAVITAVFFVASLIRFPLGPASVHLILSGLVGVVLGQRAFVSILVGIILQALLFGHGGVSVIGVNTLMLGGGALVAHGVWSLRRRLPIPKPIMGGVAGAAGVLASGCVLATVLITTGDEFLVVAQMVLGIHVGVMIFEGLVVAACVTFLLKARPDVIGEGTRGTAAAWAALALVAALWAPSPAAAHKLLLDYTPMPEGVLVEAFFPDGKPARDIPIRLLQTDDQVVVEGRTDRAGGHIFPIPQHQDYGADADAGMGHYVRIEIPGEDLLEVTLHAVDTPVDTQVSSSGARPSKVAAEAIPFTRIAIGFGVIGVGGGLAYWAARRGRHAS